MAPNAFVPNPIGFLALKRASYQDDPRRVRDIVDIVDVVFNLVRKGLHYDLEETWRVMAQTRPSRADHLRRMLTGITNEAVEWDFSPAEPRIGRLPPGPSPRIWPCACVSPHQRYSPAL